ncbi:hypothetical protein [Tenacibaculum finnmarkense]|uniref:hypothetical protein n=1 Tax=Tenacibaculum finnmarkense TaxID=2781243 RepID=UPI001E63DBE2|nr:hypothetical protein [Tenacibaculum finnmarkense]MCD8403007.1 hypothetical protein [Tenacibaculum finnmarkense genomovar finnmarkense]MCD8410340.1 hypothetical protein [Tenacibaculum finnmarkense genomovar ulcerans]MCG8894078.1 hypothetical protein [Tenacibaculum finnmarkense]MCG8902295.1 hypothetical protein [Tenacibaculum finnmarkense]
MKSIKLSSKFTNLSLYLSLLAPILLIPIIFNTVINQGINGKIIFGSIIFLTFISFLSYLFLFVCNAKIENNTLILKKQFRTPETYTFDKIGDISSFKLKTTKYTTVKMSKTASIFEKYIIINSKSLFFNDKVDAQEKLKELKQIAK